MRVYGVKNKYWEERYKWQESLRNVGNASTNTGTEVDTTEDKFVIGKGGTIVRSPRTKKRQIQIQKRSVERLSMDKGMKARHELNKSNLENTIEI